MKPFDLEKAKNGAAVCKRDGTPVKILDFDFKLSEGTVILFKYYREDANCDVTAVNNIEEIDLFMAPTIAYAAIYKNTNSKELYSGKLVPTKEEAKKEKDLKYSEAYEFFCIGKIELQDD